MGADVNAQDSEGRTPLYEAIHKGHVPIVEYLLKNGANVHSKTRTGECPLMKAVDQNDPNIINILMKCGAHFPSASTRFVSEMVSQATRNGMTNKLECLRLAGADLETPDEMHQTPLHKAVICNCHEVAEYLLQNGVATDKKDILGHTPLDYALKLNREALATILGGDDSNTDISC